MEKYEPAISVDVETGETHDIFIKKTIESQNFVKVFMADFLVALGILNSKSVSVVCYILENVRYSDNTLIATKEQIAKGSGTSLRTVFNVLSKLQEVGFMKRQANGVYIINPNYVLKGNENKRRIIIDYYNKDDRKTKKNDNPDTPASGKNEE